MATERLQPDARMRPRRVIKQSILIWVDANIEANHPDKKKALEKLQELVDDVNLVQMPSECIQLLNKVDALKSYVITTGQLGKALVPRINEIDSLKAIFILCGNKSLHENWIKQWNKVKSVETDINQIYDQIKTVRKQNLNDEISMDVLTNGDDDQSDGNQLPPSFMYSSMLKEIFFDMNFEQAHFDKMIDKLLSNHNGNNYETRLINDFSKDYQPDRAVWWYTMECFAYTDVNKSLRALDADMIVDMAPFIVDLHHQIKQLYDEQLDALGETPFTVYRAQAMPNEVFRKLAKSNNGSLSFNSFLSTSKQRGVSLPYAQEGALQDNHVGVCFVINIDPTIRVVPYAQIKETNEQKKGALNHNLGAMKNSQGRYQEAIEYYQNALEIHRRILSEDDPEIAKTYLQIRLAYKNMAKYSEALENYTEAVRIQEKALPVNHPSFATSYNNIGAVYRKMDDYQKALTYYEKSLEIREKTLPENHPGIAASYNNMGVLFYDMKKYKQALEYLQRAQRINRISLPPTHDHITITNNLIEVVKREMN